MPITYVANAKTVSKTVKKSKNQTVIQTKDGLYTGDLLPIEIKRVTKEQVKKVPVYDEALQGRVSAFAANRVNYASTYGRDMLANDTCRSVYDKIVEACKNFANTYQNATEMQGEYAACTITLDGITLYASEIDPVICSVVYDYPEFYWLESFSYISNNSNKVLSITPLCVSEYRLGETRRTLQNTMDEEIARYLELVDEATSDYQKELIIHDEIINQVKYSLNGSGNPSEEKWAHSIVGVFDPSIKKVVCEGYAKAFQLLMNACNIDCIFVTGTGNGGGHGWNKVKLGGDWYNVDVTWDDPVTNDGSNFLRHNYFNLTDNEFYNDHRPGNTTLTGINGWCYDLPISNADTYKFGNTATDHEYEVTIEPLTDGNLTLYKGTEEISSGDLVAAGTVLTIKATPNNQNCTYTATYKINNESSKSMVQNGSDGSYYYTATFEMEERELTISASLEAVVEKYTVTFDSKGGSNVPELSNITKGSKIANLPTPTYEGYIFQGWYTDEAYTQVFDANSEVNGDITLYAKWNAAELERIEASYTGNNLIVGTTINKSDIDVIAVYNDGTRKILLPTKFDINPETISNIGTNTIEVSYNGKTANVIINGIEENRVCTVTFDSQGGSSVPPISNVKKGDKITLPANPIRNEYFFGGWYTQKSCLTKFSADSEITSDITLYAKWVPLLDDPKKTIKEISAIYTGNSILVGNSISKSDVKVTVTDLNGTKHNVTAFTISNYKITAVGNNTLTANYGGFSATFTVNGISTSGSGSYKYVTHVSASYHGGPVEVGSSVDRNNITVIVAYNDNSIAYITDFSLSNYVITSIGKNTIYVYYYGYTVSITVDGVAKGSLTHTTPVQPSDPTSMISSYSSISLSVMTGGYQGSVNPRISLTTSTYYSTITAEIEEKVLASAIEGKELGNTNILQLTFNNIGSQILTELNRSNVNEVYIKICMPVQYYGRNEIQISNIPLDNAILNIIKNSSKTVVIQYIGSSYSSNTGKTYYTSPLCSLTLKGKEFNSTANSNVALQVTTLEKDYKIESAVNQYLKLEDRGKGIVVTLGQNGELNKFGSVTVNVDGALEKEHGDTVYVYGYNAKTKKLEELPVTKYKVDQNHNILVALSTYSKYVILSEETSQQVVTIASRSKVSKSLTIKRNKNKQVAITLPSDIGKNDVKITYKSSNSKIAYVSKTGKVYGKKKGKAVITTTITFGNYSKKFTTKIVIK